MLLHTGVNNISYAEEYKMAKKKKKKIGKLELEYRSLRSSITKSISRAREQGFDIEYAMHKPDKITKRYLNQLRGIKLAQVKQGVSMPGLTITTRQTGTGMDLRPSRNPAARDIQKHRKQKPKAPKPEPSAPTPESEPSAPIPEPEPEREWFAPVDADYYIDTRTGEHLLPGDRRLYETDKDGNVKVDPAGNPIIKTDMVPVTGKPLTSEQYEKLTWEYILEMYDLNIHYGDNNAKQNTDTFFKWLKEMREKYGVFALRDMLSHAADSGYGITRGTFYKSASQFASILAQMHTMLQVGEYNNDDLMSMSNAAEGAEGGYMIPD